jgi:predicted transcriptional regulator
MGQKPKIDRVKLNHLLREGKSQKDIAQIMGVSEAAISKAKKEFNVNVVRSVALENAHRVVDKNLNAVEQLQKINQTTNQLLDELTGEDQLINRMVKAVERFLMYEGDPVKQREHIKQIILQANQDKNTALKACAEIRNQLKLQLEIFQMLYDMKAVQEFQEEVLGTLAEISPEVRDAIVSKLNQKRAIRSAIKFN